MSFYQDNNGNNNDGNDKEKGQWKYTPADSEYYDGADCHFCSKCKARIDSRQPFRIDGDGTYRCSQCLTKDEIREYFYGAMSYKPPIPAKMTDEEKAAYRTRRTARLKAERNKVVPIFDEERDCSFKKPTEIVKRLDEYVVGQTDAKKKLAVAAYNHYKRLSMPDKEIDKSNVLLIGPTGSGKTFLVQNLAKVLDVPVAIADATSLTEAGYVGDDVESVLVGLVDAAGGDVRKAEQGIIFIDEIDKIARRKMENTKEVGGVGVQQALLKILEGCESYIPAGGMNMSGKRQDIMLNTRNILFICGGAFPDIEPIIAGRLSTGSAGMGFGASVGEEMENKENILSEVTQDDLREFGLIPEFLGRLPVITTLDGLTVDTLKRILTEPKNAIINQYKELLAFDEIKLTIADDALTAIAEKALIKGTGARSLRSVLEEALGDIMYYLPAEKEIGEVIITKDYIDGTGDFIRVPRDFRVEVNG